MGHSKTLVLLNGSMDAATIKSLRKKYFFAPLMLWYMKHCNYEKLKPRLIKLGMSHVRNESAEEVAYLQNMFDTIFKDYIVNYQDLQGIGMTDKLALPTVIALCSIAIGRPTLSSLAVLGDISIGGTLIKVDELANTLQACADCGAKKVLLPAVSMVDFATVPADLMTAFQLIPYQNAEDAVFKALGVE